MFDDIKNVNFDNLSIFLQNLETGQSLDLGEETVKVAKRELRKLVQISEKYSSSADVKASLTGDMRVDELVLKRSQRIVTLFAEALKVDANKRLYKKPEKAALYSTALDRWGKAIEDELKRGELVNRYDFDRINREFLDLFSLEDLQRIQALVDSTTQGFSPGLISKAVEIAFLKLGTILLFDKIGVRLDREHWNNFTDMYATDERSTVIEMFDGLARAFRNGDNARFQAISDYVSHANQYDVRLPLHSLTLLSPAILNECVNNERFNINLIRTYAFSNRQEFANGKYVHSDLFQESVDGQRYAESGALTDPNINMTECTKIFQLCGGYPSAVKYFLNQARAPSEHPLYDEIIDLGNQEKTAAAVPLLVNIVDKGYPQLASDICEMLRSDPDQGIQLLDFCSAGFLSDAQYLLSHQEDPLVAVLLREASSSNGEAVHQAVRHLAIDDRSPILAEAIKADGLTDKNKNLLLLDIQGRHDIVEETLGNRQGVLSKIVSQLIDFGQPDLAAELHDLQNTDSIGNWIRVIKSRGVDFGVEELAQMIFIQKDLEALRQNANSMQKFKLRNAEAEITQALGQGYRDKQGLDKILLSIQLGLMDSSPGIVMKASDTGQIIQDRFKTAMGLGAKSFGQQLREKFSQPKAELAFCEAVAVCCISPSGSVSPLLAKELSEHPDYREFLARQTREVQSQVSRALAIFETDPDFSVRLSTAKVPARNSQEEKLIKQQLNKGRKDNLTKQDVCSVIMSGLFTPTRQGRIGSCFSTAIVIQQERSQEGLRQILEDHLSLVNNGALYRKNFISGVRQPYLGQFQICDVSDLNQGHLLNRAREYTIASMGGSWKRGLNEMNQIILRSTLVTEGGELISDMPTEFQEDLQYGIERWFSDNIDNRFIPQMHDVVTDKRGGWKMCWKGKNGYSLIETRRSYKDMHEQCLQEVLTNLSKDSRYSQKLTEDNIRDLKARVAGMITMRYFDMYSSQINLGGFPYQLYAANFEKEACLVRRGEVQSPANLFGLLARNIKGMSRSVKEAIRKDPDCLLPLGMPNHALSFQPYQMLEYVGNGDTLQDYDNFVSRPRSIVFADNNYEVASEFLFCSEDDDLLMKRGGGVDSRIDIPEKRYQGLWEVLDFPDIPSRFNVIRA